MYWWKRRQDRANVTMDSGGRRERMSETVSGGREKALVCGGCVFALIPRSATVIRAFARRRRRRRPSRENMASGGKSCEKI
jgi:hypothetical protein